MKLTDYGKKYLEDLFRKAVEELATPKHPAKFTEQIISAAAAYISPFDSVLDPFAGTGRVHMFRPTGFTVGVEIEPEWANISPYTLVGNALHLPFRDGCFDVILTSPTYGNRMADHHNAKEKCKACRGSGVEEWEVLETDTTIAYPVPCDFCNGTGKREHVRHTYRHTLGRKLHPDNSGQLQWGEPYREFHRAAWAEAVRVLRPGGTFLLNVSDHIRKGCEVPVSIWHKSLLESMDLHLQGEELIPTPRLKHGQNSEARVEHEHLYAFIKPYVTKTTALPFETATVGWVDSDGHGHTEELKGEFTLTTTDITKGGERP